MLTIPITLHPPLLPLCPLPPTLPPLLNNTDTNLLQRFDLFQLLSTEFWWTIGSERGRVWGRGGWRIHDLDQHGVGHKTNGAHAMRGASWGSIPEDFLEEGDGNRFWSVFVWRQRGRDFKSKE